MNSEVIFKDVGAGTISEKVINLTGNTTSGLALQLTGVGLDAADVSVKVEARLNNKEVFAPIHIDDETGIAYTFLQDGSYIKVNKDFMKSMEVKFTIDWGAATSGNISMSALWE